MFTDITTFAITSSFVLLCLLVLQTWYHERTTSQLNDALEEALDDLKFSDLVVADQLAQLTTQAQIIQQLSTYNQLRRAYDATPQPYELPFNVVELDTSRVHREV